MNKAEAFASNIKATAKMVAAEANIPVWLIVTQAAHESAYGLSGLSTLGKNLFGFTGESWAKAGKPVIAMPTTEWKDGKAYKTTRPFRKYPSWTESMRDYARLLTTQPRYKDVVSAARRGDVQATFDALTASGYATDPGYGAKLVSVHRALKPYLV